jgi:serine/threonine-protein kinase RsbW
MHRLESEATPAVLDRVHTLLAVLDTDEISRTRLGIAVAELVANVVEHGRTEDGRPPYMILTVESGDAGLTAEIHDDGIGFPPHPRRDVDELAESGRGIALALDAVDELDFERSEGRNHWRLLVRPPG